MKTNTEKGSAKDRIIEVASDLFYRQGYNATGVQQIIDEAGLAKGTFYTHFKSKEDLGSAYLEKRNRDEISHLRQALQRVKDPKKRYLAFVPIMQAWMEETGYRGCAFANMAAEVVDVKSPIRKQAKHHYETFRATIREMVKDLSESDPKYSKLDIPYVSDQFMTLVIGAITNAEIYHESWPFESVAVAVKKLINE